MEGFGSCLETLLGGCKGMGLDKTGEEERLAWLLSRHVIFDSDLGYHLSTAIWSV